MEPVIGTDGSYGLVRPGVLVWKGRQIVWLDDLVWSLVGLEDEGEAAEFLMLYWAFTGDAAERNVAEVVDRCLRGDERERALRLIGA